MRNSAPLLRWSLRVCAVVLLFVFAAIALLYFRQHSMIYHPYAYPPNYAQKLPPDAIELHFKTIAGKQTAFYLPRGAGKQLPQRLWVAFCGNASLALDWMDLITHDRKEGDGFLLIDYPGYGRSEGYADIATTRGAADNALDALASHLHVEKPQLELHLNTIGHSLGTAVALDFARRHFVQRIILIAVFTTLREEGATVVGNSLSHLLVENYDNRAALRELSQRSPPPRVVIFHGTKDNVIPVRMGRELAEAFPAFVEFHGVVDADHVNVLSKAEQEILAAMND
jgi:pimeloyl-ACP methyl ester carboxylesterase